MPKINMFMVGVLFGFLPFYLYDIGYTPLESGGVFALATFSCRLVQPLAGHRADKIDIAKAMFVGLLLVALTISTVTFAARIPLVIVAGVGIGTVWTNSDALVSTPATKHQLGASIGVAQSFKEFAIWPVKYWSASSRNCLASGSDLLLAAPSRWRVWSWLVRGGFAAPKN